MTTKRRVIITIIIIVTAIVLTLFILSPKITQWHYDVQASDGLFWCDNDCDVISETTLVTESSVTEISSPVQEYVTEISTRKLYADEDFAVDTDFLYTPYDVFNDGNCDVEGLLGDIRRFDMNALTVTFDNIEFKAGMYVRDIVDNSYWYTVRENDIVQPDSAAFVRLNNDYWTNAEIMLNNDKAIYNGDVILWVHNYSDKEAAIKDCVIYKYQISYAGCWDLYTEHPNLQYRDMTFGSDTFTMADSIQGVTINDTVCTRYIYGDLSECQVILDADDNGLIGITVIYNEYYGPDFNKGGDNNG